MRRYLLDTGIAQDFINDRNGVGTGGDMKEVPGLTVENWAI
jgi:hypothetical protein